MRNWHSATVQGIAGDIVKVFVGKLIDLIHFIRENIVETDVL